MLKYLFLALAAIGLADADVAVVIGGEIDSERGFETVGTVTTISNKCGLFNNSLPDLPQPKKSAAAAFLDNRIYVCGGYHPLHEDRSCFMLDLANPTEWTEIAPLNHGRYKLALVAAGNAVYAVAGDAAFYNFHSVEVYDVENDVWVVSDTLELPGTHEGFCAVGYHDEGIFIVGGYDETGDRKRLQFMSLADGLVTTLDHMLENRTNPGCVLYKSGFAVAGGWSGDSTIPHDMKPNKKVEYYDIDTGKWSYMTDMNHRRADFGIAGIENGEYIIAIAGWQETEQQLDSYEQFTPSDGTGGLEGVWTYGATRFDDGVCEFSIVTIPSDMFPNECK